MRAPRCITPRPRNARTLHRPLTVIESLAVSTRIERFLTRIQPTMLRALDDLLTEGRAEALAFFKGYGETSETEAQAALRAAWWYGAISPRLVSEFGFVRHGEHRLYFHNGVFGRHGTMIEVCLYSGSGRPGARSRLDRHSAHSTVLNVDVFAWMRDLLAGGKQLAFATLAEACHQEIARLGAWNTLPGSIVEDSEALSSVEIFVRARGRAALLHRLGYEGWTVEAPAISARFAPQGLNVLPCREIVPVAHEDRGKALFDRVGKQYFDTLRWFAASTWPNDWPSTAYGFAVLGSVSGDEPKRPS